MMDWNDLRFFLAVARGKSLSAAARSLTVNHSTVFRRIKGLEERLGARLFDRLSSGYELTPPGERMMAAALGIEEEMLALERRMTGHDRRLGGVVRVTTTDSLANGFLMPLLAAFHDAYPGIELDLRLTNEVFNLSKREADVAIRPSVRVTGDMVGRKLGDIGFAVYGAKDYLDRRGRPRSAADLAGHDLVSLDASMSRARVSRWLMKHAGDVRPVYRSNSLFNQMQAISNGFGVGVLPCHLADRHGGLERVFMPRPALTVPLWLLTHADLAKTARIRAFLDFIAAAARADRALLAGRQNPAAEAELSVP